MWSMSSYGFGYSSYTKEVFYLSIFDFSLFKLVNFCDHLCQSVSSDPRGVEAVEEKSFWVEKIDFHYALLLLVFIVELICFLGLFEKKLKKLSEFYCRFRLSCHTLMKV